MRHTHYLFLASAQLKNRAEQQRLERDERARKRSLKRGGKGRAPLSGLPAH